MSPVEPSDDFPVAFSIAAGREPAGTVAPELLAFARRLIGYGRVIAADTPCPTPWLRRAEAIFSARPATVGTALWSLLFDSAASTAAATRGPVRSRFLRLGGEGGAIEAELTGIGTDDVRLVGALEGVAIASRSKAVVVFEPTVGAPVRVPVGDGGTFDVRVPSRVTAFALSVRVGRRVVARSSRLDLVPR